MANVKITDLAADTNPASTDVLPFVDISADATKKVTIADLLENAGNGSAGAPAFAFDSDADTGMYRSGADALGFTTGGTGRLFIDSSGRLLMGSSVAGNADADNINVAGAGNVGITFRGSSSGTGNIFFADGTSGDDLKRGQIVYDHSGNSMRLHTNTVERLRIDSSGRLLVGTTTSLTDRKASANRTGSISVLQPASQSGLVVVTNQTSSNDAAGGRISVQRFVGASTAVLDNDELGSIVFGGSTGDGSSTCRNAAQIAVNVDGTPGSNDMPGRLVFSTTADGSSTPTEHFRIASNGDLTATDTTIGSNSDSRLKTNVANFTYNLDIFKQYQPKIFDWKNPELHGNKTSQRGFIAQDVEAIDAYCVSQQAVDEDSAMLSILMKIVLLKR